MSLPVSQYEALLAEVRGLRRQAQHVQQLADPLLFNQSIHNQDQNVTPQCSSENSIMMASHKSSSLRDHIVETDTCNLEGAEGYNVQNADGKANEIHRIGTTDAWSFGPASMSIHRQMDIPSAMSFASSSGAPIERLAITPDTSKCSSQQLEAKVDMVYSLLAMLGGQEHADMGETLLALSTNRESCLAMRHSGCIPLLVQMVHSDKNTETRKKASKALHNLIQSQPDEKIRKRETRILKLLDTICSYMEALIDKVEFVCESLSEDGDDKHPVQTIAHLMKLSFDEGHRHAICNLGGIHTIAKLVEAEHLIHGSIIDDTQCILMRRYACMALTNLTFGDSGNKALLCSYKDFMKALVIQLQSPSDELRQVTASVLRNLSWRADSSSKEILKEVGSVKGLTKAAMLDNKENTLKSILSALWNLSAHCTENKSEICSVEGALGYLVHLLSYKSSSKSLAIIENSGGILRNISSQIAVRDDYREILRERNCLQILLSQLKSPSLTIVSNACGTLWNLSAKNETDQDLLWQLGAPAMLRSLNHSKHKMIAMGSSATLKNLLSAKPDQPLLPQLDSTALALDLPALPTLGMRKQKALLKDLDQNLTETFDNIDRNPDCNKSKGATKLSNKSADGSFASLNTNEPSTSFTNDANSCHSSSLPYMNQSVDESIDFKISKNRTNVDSSTSRTNANCLEEAFRSFDSKTDSSNVIDNDRHRFEKRYKEVIGNMDEKDHCSIEDISDCEIQQVSCESNQLSEHDQKFENKWAKNEKVGEYQNIRKPHELVEDNASLKDELNEKQDSGREKNAIDGNTVENQYKSPSASTSKVLPSKLKTSAIPKSKLPSRCYTQNSNLKTKNPESCHFDEITPSNSTSRTEVSRPIPHNGISLPQSSSGSQFDVIGSNMMRQEIIETSQVSKVDLNERDDISTSASVENTSVNVENCSNELKKSIIQRSKPNIDYRKSDNLNISEESNACQLSTSQDIFDAPSRLTNDEVSQNVHMDAKPESHPGQKSPKVENLPINMQNNESYKFIGKVLDMSPEYAYTSDNCAVFNDKNGERLERSCNDSANILDTRMLDPEAMIESLDRFTAELVSQASTHLQNRDSMYKSGATNTWDEEASQNEVTFPSISVSAPNVVSFTNSNNESQCSNKCDISDALQDEKHQSLDTTNTMTDSILIAMEATKIAAVFKEAAEKSSSANSLNSMELDGIQPPSHLNSLSNSIIGFDSKPNSPKMMRKKSLPSNIMFRRTLNQLQHTSSVDNIDKADTSCRTNIGASKTDDDKILGSDFQASSLLARITGSIHLMDSMTDLENMNPPSLFNEVTCNSLADVATSELCNETEIFESCFSNTECDVTEFSDACSVTPIQSDVNSSSCENLSKKQKMLSKNLTSKQRRALTKERYRTYTIAAGMIMKESQDAPPPDEEVQKNGNKTLTPKERRLSDRLRFETQVLDVSQLPNIRNVESESDVSSSNNSPQASPMKSRISVRKNFLHKRLNGKERFMTQTLDPQMDSELHQIVEKEANKIVSTLKDIKTQDELLECETLSLVSNEDESEQNPVNYRTYHKSWGMKNSPILQQVKNIASNSDKGSDDSDVDKTPRKPKIVKPDEKKIQENPSDSDEPKAVRGRRKPLYTKANVNKITPKSIKPLKNIAPNVISNVNPVKPKTISKPVPRDEKTTKNIRPTSSGSPKKIPTTPLRNSFPPKPLERQGTFTKDHDTSPKSPKITPKQSSIPRFGLLKSASSDRNAARASNITYNRSTSADGHENASRKIQNSSSTHSLKNEQGRIQPNGAIKKTFQNQRSNSNASLNNSTKKQVTSKIASIWRKIEDSKKKTVPKNDSRKWIEVHKENENDDDDSQKRISRLGSFIVMNENEEVN